MKFINRFWDILHYQLSYHTSHLGTLLTFILTITVKSVEVLHFASLGGRSNPKYLKCTCSKGVGLVQTPLLSVTSMKSEGSVTDRGKILTSFP